MTRKEEKYKKRYKKTGSPENGFYRKPTKSGVDYIYVLRWW
jgi:hypothetical protein